MGIKKVNDGVTASLRRVQSDLDRLPAQAYNYFVKITPKDTGNARRSTRLTNNKVIEANYPYAQPLDRGWSRQAPQGMTKPTEQFIKTQLSRIIRK